MIGVYNIPTESLGIFDKYIEQIKPYHTKILESSITFTYTDYVNGAIIDVMDTVIDEGLPYSNQYVCESASIFGTYFDPGLIGGNTICSLSYIPSGYDDFVFDSDTPQTILTITSATSGSITVQGNYSLQLIFGTFLQIRNAQQSSGFYRVVASTYNSTTNETTIIIGSSIGQFVGGELVFGLEGFDPMYTYMNTNPGIINVIIEEDFQITQSVNLIDSIYGYNFENTDSNGYDVFSFGNEYDMVPHAISQNVQLLPSLGTTATGNVYSGINAAVNSTLVPEGYDGYMYEDFFDRQPYTVWFPYYYTNGGDISGQGLLLTGGNYVRRFENIHEISMYDELYLLQVAKTATLGIQSARFTSTPTTSGIVSSNTIEVSGNFQSVFSPGYAFYIAGSELNDGWYVVSNAIYDGVHTIITINIPIKVMVYTNPDGSVITNNFNRQFGYIIPAIFTNQLINPATILLVDYAFFNATEISYIQNGPMNIGTIETFEPGLISSTVYDRNVFTPDLTLDDYTLPIVSIFEPDRFALDGNVTQFFQPLAKFYIVNSSATGSLNPEQVCLSSKFDQSTNQTIVTLLGDLPMTTEPYGVVQFTLSDDVPNLTSTTISEQFSFGWNHAEWFQYLIVGANTLTNQLFVNAPQQGLGNVPPGIDIKVVNGSNAGMYQVETSSFSVTSGLLIITTTTPIVSGVGGGYVEPPVDMESGLVFVDKVNSTIIDAQLGTVYTMNDVDMINTWSTSYWSVGSFS